MVVKKGSADNHIILINTVITTNYYHYHCNYLYLDKITVCRQFLIYFYEGLKKFIMSCPFICWEI